MNRMFHYNNRIYVYNYVGLIEIQVPHEVKHQRAIAKMTSQVMENGQDVIIQNGQI